MMLEHRKSAPAVVAVKPTNEAGRPAAEPAEPRAGIKGMRASKTRAGHRTGKVRQMRWTAYGKSQGKGRRRSSPRSSTTSVLSCSKRRSTNLRRMPHPEQTG
jgi:hypothetical protein